MQFLSCYQLEYLYFSSFCFPPCCQHTTHLNAATIRMLLLYSICILVISAELALLAPSKERQQEFVCIDQACYSIAWDMRKYARAKRACEERKQHLITIKSEKEANAISLLISKVKSDDFKVWIGLEPKKGCTDLTQPLRGFTWVTGDSYTDSILWKNDKQKCSESGDLCVIMNNNGTWEETDCTLKSDGLLCESSHSSSCSPLRLPIDYSVTYVHPSYGMGLSESEFYPSGTSIHIPTIQEDLFCGDMGEWNKTTPGAWPCVIAKGGCDHDCIVVNGIPECTCPLGSKLKQDKRSCSLPCEPNLCSQDCYPKTEPPHSPCRCSEGYLAEDGKTCLDKDCKDPSNICGYHCPNINGSFTCDCKSGFEKIYKDCESPGECGFKCQDMDECVNTICEQKCENSYGGFKCVCNEGYVLDEKNHKKCKKFCNTSVCKAECIETKCICPEGYILDGIEGNCVDVDECLDSPCKSCTNLFGSFECTCPEGFTVHGAECVPDGTEGPREVTTETTLSSDSFPQSTFSMEPTVLLGICIGVISMLTVLIAMVCFMLRKHYMDQHDFNYKTKNTEKYVVLQQVKTIPQWKF